MSLISASDDDRERLRRIAKSALNGERPTTMTAIQVWSELLDGHWIIADIFDDVDEEAISFRFVLAQYRSSDDDAAQPLTQREREVLASIAAGSSIKETGAELGLTVTTLNTHLRCVLKKLGMASRIDVARVFGPGLVSSKLALAPPADAVAARLVHPPHSYAAIRFHITHLSLDSLSAVEREVAHAILNGITVSQLARLRGRSPRTIMNQLTSIVRKLGMRSRAELLATAGR